MKKYTVYSALDRKQRPLGTLEVDDKGKASGFVTHDGKQSPLFAPSIKVGETLNQLMASYRNYVFYAEGDKTDEQPEGTAGAGSGKSSAATGAV